MLEPSLAFQTAVRAALIADPAVTERVPASSIRSGTTRPSSSPCILLGDAHSELLGRAPGGQIVARVMLTGHVWALEDGADTGKQIGAALIRTLLDAPRPTSGFELDYYERPAVAWMRDTSSEAAWTHGVLELEAVLRWRE
jgi:hypothetical protein